MEFAKIYQMLSGLLIICLLFLTICRLLAMADGDLQFHF